MFADLEWQIAILVFGGRVFDVSLGTVRMILTISGARYRAAGISLVEIVIWVLAVGGVVTNLTDPLVVVAYAAGFATGTIVGSWMEERLAIGFRTVQIMNARPEIDIAAHLRSKGFRVTRLAGAGMASQVEVLISIIPRRQLNLLRQTVEEVAPRAFITIERADRPSGGDLIGTTQGMRRAWLRGLLRK